MLKCSRYSWYTSCSVFLPLLIDVLSFGMLHLTVFGNLIRMRHSSFRRWLRTWRILAETIVEILTLGYWTIR